MAEHLLDSAFDSSFESVPYFDNMVLFLSSNGKEVYIVNSTVILFLTMTVILSILFSCLMFIKHSVGTYDMNRYKHSNQITFGAIQSYITLLCEQSEVKNRRKFTKQMAEIGEYVQKEKSKFGFDSVSKEIDVIDSEDEIELRDGFYPYDKSEGAWSSDKKHDSESCYDSDLYSSSDESEEEKEKEESDVVEEKSDDKEESDKDCLDEKNKDDKESERNAQDIHSMD